MKFFAFATTLLAGTAAALPALLPRDLTSIQNALTNIDNKIVDLNNSLNTFNPKSPSVLPQLLDIITKTNTVGTAVINATKAANASTPLDLNDSVQVGLAVITLQQFLYPLLDNLSAHKKAFDSVAVYFSVRKTVLGALQLEKKLAGDLGAAIRRKISSDLYDTADMLIADINSHFDSTIAVYSVPAKGVELPAIPSGVTPGGQVYRREIEDLE